MQWDWQNRTLRLSVGELARFSLFSGGEDGSGRWRAELGTHWHGVLRERAEAEQAGWAFEQGISGTLQQEGWHFQLEGRIDQLKREPDPVLREIKTISLSLPADECDLRQAYPQHFHQAMLYGFLMARQDRFPQTELVFLEIATGITQTVVLGDADLEDLHEHLKSVATILEDRRGHFSRLRSLEVPQPFEQWRDGQPQARAALAAALDSGQPVLLEAPTGFGKTGLVLEQALLRMAAGEIERILILTGKNTGHTPLVDQLAAFKESMPELTLHALRSRKDHTLDAELEEALSQSEILERWSASGLSAKALLADGVLDLESVRILGQRHGIPPWAISRMLLPYADAWIADFNYLFDPAVSRVPDSIPGYAPGKTLLIIDEAHNLPDRVAGSHSHRLDSREVEAVRTDVQFARFPGKLGRLLDQLQSTLKKQDAAESLDPPAEADLYGLLKDIRSALEESSFGMDELSETSREWLWNLPWLLADWEQPDLPMQVHAPRKGTIAISCLDASAAIAPVLERFHRTVLMSATLRPWDSFRKAIGLTKPGQVSSILGESPWLEGCFEVMVDARVDTRFKQRERYLETTTRTIGDSASARKGCLAAFFPSYRYAEQVLERTQFLYPALRCEIQPRDLTLEQQNQFLESALLFDDVLFLVLGSRFGEGIDALGGRVSEAIVVSPALPEVNNLQRERERLVPGGKAAAFHEIYLIPGMRKISQALGRLVRNPEHRARVLLHGKRFMEPVYQDLLPEYLQPVDFIVTDGEFRSKWLRVRD
jgi:Rad3-related DNA helicase